jgi:hypothetical protein
MPVELAMATMPKVPIPPGIGIDPPSVDCTPTVLVGGITVTLNEQLAVLPLVSVAVQVTVVVPSGKVEPGAGEQLVVTPGQLSVAVTV